MHPYLCTTCGTQYTPSANPPPECPVCEDDRQLRPRLRPGMDHFRAAHQRPHQHLLFLSVNGALMARPFDPASAQFTGEAFPAADRVVSSPAGVVADVSEAGVLVYREGAEFVSDLMILNRRG
ncbi:MAG: hypothetical protein SFV54_24325 [Bryobacteraceae bacterium]|nr:hypothetical protein [Bryobacteraceae bacterium]